MHKVSNKNIVKYFSFNSLFDLFLVNKNSVFNSNYFIQHVNLGGYSMSIKEIKKLTKEVLTEWNYIWIYTKFKLS